MEEILLVVKAFNINTIDLNSHNNIIVFMENQNPTDPLGSLMADQYKVEILKYPENVNASGHFINFYIHKNIHANLQSSYIYDATPDSDKNFNTYNIKKGMSEQLFSLNYTKIKSKISLYTPDDSITFSSKHNWSQTSLTKILGAIGSGLESITDLTTSSIGTKSDMIPAIASLAAPLAHIISHRVLIGDPKADGRPEVPGVIDNTFNRIFGPDFTKVLKSNVANTLGSVFDEKFMTGLLGYAVNPQYLMMYSETGFRSFAFRFLFTPNNREESLQVNKIIQTFRFHSAPEIAGLTGRFHIAPSIFELEFMHKNATNPNIPKIAPCALVATTVDYAPRGWSTHTDGMPVHTMLQLHFMEVEIITKEKIQVGF